MYFKIIALAGFLAAIPGAAADAAVTYTFTGTGDGTNGVTGFFTFTTPNFIIADRLVDASDLDNCAVATPLGAACGFVRFYQTSPIDNSANDVIEFQPVGTIGARYAFADQAFQNYGTYSTITLGVNTVGTLTVANAIAAVPEPATWATMLAGFGMVGGALRRRSRVAVRRVTYA